jgi:hypothetical protein
MGEFKKRLKSYKPFLILLLLTNESKIITHLRQSEKSKKKLDIISNGVKDHQIVKLHNIIPTSTYILLYIPLLVGRIIHTSLF